MDKAKRSALKAEYREKVARAGIIQVTNTKNDKVLIIAVNDVDARLNRFKAELGFGSCWFQELQKEWKTFGAEAFTFEVVDLIEHPEELSEYALASELNDMEILWCEKLEPYGERGYNKPPSDK